MAGKGHGVDAAYGMSLETYGDTVTVTLPKRTARDLYYALSLAMGGSPPYGEPSWGGKGNGKGKGKSKNGGKGAPKPRA